MLFNEIINPIVYLDDCHSHKFDRKLRFELSKNYFDIAQKNLLDKVLVDDIMDSGL